jgi:hypothetical protein
MPVLVAAAFFHSFTAAKTTCAVPKALLVPRMAAAVPQSFRIIEICIAPLSELPPFRLLHW